MATELKSVQSRTGEVTVTRFGGKSTEGVCVQLTPAYGERVLSLTKSQALELAVALVEFANSTREEA